MGADLVVFALVLTEEREVVELLGDVRVVGPEQLQIYEYEI